MDSCSATTPPSLNQQPPNPSREQPHQEPARSAGPLDLCPRFDVDSSKLLHRLAVLGWLGDGTPEERIRHALAVSARALKTVLLAYQHFHGLDADHGLPDAETLRSLSEPRFCGLPDIMPMQMQLARWQNHDLTWSFTGSDWPRIGQGAAKEAFALAWAQWMKVCGIRASYAPSGKAADVQVGVGPIDGPMNTLAWSELPGNDQWQGPSRQLFDQGESWCVSQDPPRFQIDLVRVAGHEIGHILGLPHLAAGNLLQPLYDVRIRSPQQGDIQEVVARYGKPAADAPPGIPSPGKSSIIIEIEGIIDGAILPGYQLTRVVS